MKKGVSWALHAAGGRNRVLNRAAIELARRLAESPEPGPRWVGKDAIRKLTSEATKQRAAAGSRTKA